MFRGEYLQKQKDESFKNQLIAASFTAWQMLASQGLKDNWRRYLKKLNLIDEVKVTKEQLKKEVENAMENVQRLVKKAKNG